jgi:SAM-dependent methyltransferase
MYRASIEQINADKAQYERVRPDFVPFKMSDHQVYDLGLRYSALLSTQNGQDIDDYVVGDDNKVERYMSGLAEGSRVLLMGTGTGREVLVAKSLGYNATGTTFGSRNVDFGRTVLGLAEHELMECATECMPFPDGLFDAVGGFQILEHAISPFIFLSETRRVMKSGGKIVLEWPPAQQFSTGRNPHHQVCLCPGQAADLLDKALFRDIRVFYNNGEDIPEEEFWSAKTYGKMLVAEAYKE